MKIRKQIRNKRYAYKQVKIKNLTKYSYRER